MAERLANIDLSLAQAVAEKVGAPIPQEQRRPNHGKRTKGVSMSDVGPEKPTIASRRIAILIADGYDHASYANVKQAIKDAGALPFTIADKRQKIKARGGEEAAQPDNHFNAMRSTMFDALFIPDSSHIEALRASGLVRFWVREAFAHCKAIGAVGKAVELVQDAIAETRGVKLAGVSNSSVTESYGVVTQGRVKPGVGDVVEKAAREFWQTFFAEIAKHRCWSRELDGLTDAVAC